MTMTMPERAAIHAYLSPEARDRIQLLADDNGTSMTGLLEAMADLIDEFDEETIREWIRRARKVDAIRRRRRAS